MYITYLTRNGSKYLTSAVVIENANGWKTLQSYQTQVAQITPKGEIRRTWAGRNYGRMSPTTMRHINCFLAMFHTHKRFSKNEWLSLPLSELHE